MTKRISVRTHGSIQDPRRCHACSPALRHRTCTPVCSASFCRPDIVSSLGDIGRLS